MKKKLIKMKKKENKNNEILFKEGMELFWERCNNKNLSKATIKHYTDILNYSFYNFFDYNNRISNITEKTIQEYIKFMQDKGIKDISINTNLRALKTILLFFMENGLLKEFKINKIKQAEKKPLLYTTEEIKKLLEKPNLNNCTFAEYRNWVITSFIINTGARTSTVINIQKEDLDLENNTVFYRHTKNGKGQTVFITKHMQKIFKEYLEYLPEEEKYVFPNTYGGQLLARSLTHTLAEYNKYRGINKTGVHRLRHFFAKQSILNGMDIFTLQRYLGHKDFNLLQTYVTMLVEDIKQTENINPLETLISSNKKYIKIKK